MTAQEPPPKDDKALPKRPQNTQKVRDEQTWERFERALKKVAHPTKHPKPDPSD
jgi:hypothetical protein